MAFENGDVEILKEASKYKGRMMPRKLGIKANEILARNGLTLYDPKYFVTEEKDVPKGEPPTDDDYDEAIRNVMESKVADAPDNGPSRADSSILAEDYWVKSKGLKDEDVLTPEERAFLKNFIKAHYGSNEDYDRSEGKF